MRDFNFKAKFGISVYGLVIITMAITMGFFVWLTLANIRHNCLQLETVKHNLYIQVKNADGRLDHVQYYRDHPQEALDAHKANKEILKALSPEHCKGFFG